MNPKRERNADDVIEDLRKQELAQIEEPMSTEEVDITLLTCRNRQGKELVRRLMLEHKEIANERDYIKKYQKLIVDKFGCKPSDNFIKVNVDAMKNNTLTIDQKVLPKDQTYEYEYNGKIIKRTYKSNSPNTCNLKVNRDKVKQFLIDNPNMRYGVQTNLISKIKYETGIDISLSALRKYLTEIEAH